MKKTLTSQATSCLADQADLPRPNTGNGSPSSLPIGPRDVRHIMPKPSLPSIDRFYPPHHQFGPTAPQDNSYAIHHSPLPSNQSIPHPSGTPSANSNVRSGSEHSGGPPKKRRYLNDGGNLPMPNPWQQLPRADPNLVQRLLAQGNLLRNQNHILRSENLELKLLRIHNQRLIKENDKLKGSLIQLKATSLDVITNIVKSNAIVETAIDHREAVMRVGLSNLWGSVDQMKEQASQLMQFSNGTSSLVTRLLTNAMEVFKALCPPEKRHYLEEMHSNTEPSPEVAAMLWEELPFSLEDADKTVA